MSYTQLVRTWYVRSADRVHPWYRQGLHVVQRSYSTGLRMARSWSSQGLKAARSTYARGMDAARGRTPSKTSQAEQPTIIHAVPAEPKAATRTAPARAVRKPLPDAPKPRTKSSGTRSKTSRPSAARSNTEVAVK